ncbi:MAG: diacylglycerol kinase family protein [Deferribacterota bacterium]|nr:diacylglycerol kinase family protein [Deferribacterota bacterium]
MPLKAEIIINPLSGNYRKNKIDKLIKLIKTKFNDTAISYTNYAKHAELIARNSKADILFVAGGDGLLNEVINGINNKECIVVPLACGTSNIFCREYNIPLNPLNALKKLDTENLSRLNIGKVNERLFCKVIGFGYDARVVNNLNYYLRRLNSKFAHMVSGVDVLLKDKFKPFHVYIKGNKVNAYTSIISIGKKYAGNYNLVKHVFYNGFTICVINNSKRKAILKNFLSILFKRGVLCDVYLYDSLQVVGIDYCQLDGEYFGLTNNRCEVTLLESNFFLANFSDNN